MRALIILLILLNLNTLKSEVILSEVSASNFRSYFDSYDRSSDWIEIYNNGDESINLMNYRISDDNDFESAFVLPDTTLKSQERIIVFASERNRISSERHFIYGSGAGFSISKPDSISFYYLNVDGDFTFSVQFNSFNTPSLPGSIGLSARNSLDNQSHFFMNNYIIFSDNNARFNYTDYKYDVIEEKFHTRFDINEFRYEIARTGDSVYARLRDSEGYIYKSLASKNRLEAKCLIGLHIASSSENQIASSCISDILLNGEVIEAKDLLKSNLNSKSYEILQDKEIHTDFKISNKDTISLFNPEGLLVSSLAVIESRPDFTTSSDGESNFLTSPSPLLSASSSFSKQLDKAIFNFEKNFFSENVIVELESPDNADIYYTLDGSQASLTNGFKYSDRILIDTHTIVTAICINDKDIDSEINTESFIKRTDFDLPIVSLSVDSMLIYGPEGILLEHRWLDTREMPAYINIYNNVDSSLISQSVNIRRSGNWYSRIGKPNSLRVKSSSKYLENKFTGELFNYERIIDDIILRNGGDDNKFTYLRDPFINVVASKFTSLDFTSYRPAAYYLNAKYMGLTNIREFYDTDYLETKHGKANYNLIENTLNIKSGSMKGLLDDLDYLDEVQDSYYEEIQEIFNIENLIEYSFIQCYFNNYDWPENNVILYNSDKDSLWQFMLKDLDWSMGIFDSSDVSFNIFDRRINTYYEDKISRFYQRNFQNDEFLDHLFSYSLEMFNSDFSSKNVLAIYDSLQKDIENEQMIHRELYDLPLFEFNHHKVKSRDFIVERSIYYLSHAVESYPRYKGIAHLSLESSPLDAAQLKINTININSEVFEGIYLQGLAVDIDQFENADYSFQYWEINDTVRVYSTSLSNHLLSDSNKIRAIYYNKDSSDFDNIVINEIMYESNQDGPGDWIELYNDGFHDVNLKNWKFLDKNSEHLPYIFYNNYILKSGEYLVISNDTISFDNFYSTEINRVGDFQFGLGRDDNLKLINPLDNVYDKVSYESQAPWPEIMEENNSIELINPKSNNEIAEMWKLSSDPSKATPGRENSITVNLENEKFNSELRAEIYQDNIIFTYNYFDNSTYKIELFDIRGLRIYSDELTLNGSGKHSINIKPKSNSVYLLKVYSDKHLHSLKLLRNS